MSVQTRKVKTILSFREDKPQRFKLMPVNAPTITFQELVTECSVSCGVNTNQTKSVIDALVNRLIHYMSVGHPVKMGDFGSFKPTFNSKTVVNPEDANNATVTRKVVRFFPGKAFRDMLSSLSIVSGSPTLNDEGTEANGDGDE